MLLAQTLPRVRSPRPTQSGRRRSGPSRSDKLLRRLRRHPTASLDCRFFSKGVSILPLASRSTDGGAEMKYMLLIYADEQAWTDAERQQCYGESTQLAHQLKSKGQFISTSPLQSVATATTVKVRD